MKTNATIPQAIIEIAGAFSIGYCAGRVAYAAYDAIKEHQRTKRAEEDISRLLRYSFDINELIAAINDCDLYTHPHRGWNRVEVGEEPPRNFTSLVMTLSEIVNEKLDSFELTVITDNGVRYLPVRDNLFIRKALGETKVKTTTFMDVVDLRS